MRIMFNLKRTWCKIPRYKIIRYGLILFKFCRSLSKGQQISRENFDVLKCNKKTINFLPDFCPALLSKKLKNKIEIVWNQTNPFFYRYDIQYAIQPCWKCNNYHQMHNLGIVIKLCIPSNIKTHLNLVPFCFWADWAVLALL